MAGREDITSLCDALDAILQRLSADESQLFEDEEEHERRDQKSEADKLGEEVVRCSDVRKLIGRFDGGASTCGRSSETVARARLELGAHAFARGQYARSVEEFERALESASAAEQCAETSGGEEPPESSDTRGLRTRALYFLAQAQQEAGDSRGAARSCAGTLRSQVDCIAGHSGANVGSDKEQMDAPSWVNNCLQLAGYFLNDELDFATARHCTAVADAVCAASLGPISKASADDDDARAAHANVRLGWAKLCVRSLSTIISADADAPIDGDVNGLAVNFYDVVRAPAAAPLPENSVGHAEGDDASGAKGGSGDGHHLSTLEDTEGRIALSLPIGIRTGDLTLARQVFNIGMSCFNAALEYYALEGWATEHCEMVIDRNALYIGLCKHETEPKRRRALQKMRTTLVTPLAAALNAEKFPGLFRSLHFEAAAAFGAIMDTYDGSAGEGGGGGDCGGRRDRDGDLKTHRHIVRAGRSSVEHYEAVISTFVKEEDSSTCSGKRDGGGLHSLHGLTGLTNDETHLLEQSLFTAARHYHRICSLENTACDTDGSRGAGMMATKAVEFFECYANLVCERKRREGDKVGDVSVQQMDIAKEMAGLLRIKYRL